MMAKAACGSEACGGCYEIAPGKKIHPPVSGEEFLKMRAYWEKEAAKKLERERDEKEDAKAKR